MSELGKLVQDKVTGMEGIATGLCVYMNGCTQYLVEPKVDKEGKKVKGEWVDAVQINVLGKGLSKDVQVDASISDGPAGGYREHPYS